MTTPLPVLADSIPASMQTERRWMLWRIEMRDGRATKVPYIASRPAERASSTDPATWTDYLTALAAYEDGKADGIGFALGDGWVGLDRDHCISEGEIDGEGQAMLEEIETYAEYSVSGTGIHLIARGTLPPGPRRMGHIEAYDSGRYFTVTGARLPEAPAEVTDCSAALARWYARVFGQNGNGKRLGEKRNTVSFLPDDAGLLECARRATNGVKFSALFDGSDWTGYPSQSEADSALVMMLAFWTGKDAQRIDRLFRQSGLMRAKWDERHGETTYGARTIAAACAKCTEVYGDRARQTTTVSEDPPSEPGRPAAPDAPLILDPADPLPSARRYVARGATVRGVLALRHHAGVFYGHQPGTGAYAERDEATIRADLYRFLEKAMRLDKTGSTRPFQPTRARVENVLDALRALTNLPASCAAPCWLQDDPGLDPCEILPFRNGLLFIPTRDLLAVTPAFFSLNGLPFDYDAGAREPARWLQFLSDLWPDDDQARETLQEWFGYLLTPDTRFQKIGMLVGPKRSGKGTIGRVIRRLLGERNVCAPTLAGLAEPFGESVLLNKTVAIIADARIGGRTDTAVITERLLAISGEDTRSVPRKFLPDWTGTLSTRFLLLTNELPRIEDASGALASRFVVLTLDRSFYGHEDHHLFERFVPELPGILNWALDGRDRLYGRGRFLQPDSSAELIQQFEDLGSPIGAFVRERCELGAGHEVSISDLFAGWKTWCQETGREKPGTVQTFGRNLRAAFPWLKGTQHRDFGLPVRYWAGLRLRH